MTNEYPPEFNAAVQRGREYIQQLMFQLIEEEDQEVIPSIVFVLWSGLTNTLLDDIMTTDDLVNDIRDAEKHLAKKYDLKKDRDFTFTPEHLEIASGRAIELNDEFLDQLEPRTRDSDATLYKVWSGLTNFLLGCGPGTRLIETVHEIKALQTDNPTSTHTPWLQ